MQTLQLKGTETADNLMKAFAGESQARNRYVFFADTARREGYMEIAEIFEETAANEQAHAKRFYNFLVEGGLNHDAVTVGADYPVSLGDTQDNLLSAAQGEHEEWAALYKEAADMAEKEGFQTVAAAYKAIAKVEEFHEQRFLELKERMERDEVFKRPEKTKWICMICGYIHEGYEAPRICPSCNHAQSYYKEKK
ncbi:MAG: rubrerythrin family protein [Lachnospiraceae bacterium]|jgi:rubrerythrin|nr:rubrerythrin family protein [Lachnospiraceae bacterium]